jgi:zinc protease
MMRIHVTGDPNCLPLSLPAPSRLDSFIPPIAYRQLTNGIALYVVEHHRLPVVSLQLIIKNGAETDPRDKEGVSSLMMEGLLLGTGKWSEDEIALALDSLGVPLLAAAGWDAGWIKAQGLSNDLDRLMEIVRDIVFNPTFPSDAFHLLKERRLGALKNKQQELAIVADEAFESLLFKDAPYGHPIDGTISSVESISIPDVSSHYHRIICPGKMAVAIVGDVCTEEVIEKASRIFEEKDGVLNAEDKSESISPTPSGRRVYLFLRPGFTQCQIRMGHPGISHDHPSYHAIKVMNYILGGGGFSSRLMEEIRVKRGYTYGIFTGFKARRHPGPFVISTFTAPAVAPEVVHHILETVESYRNSGAAGDELESAQGYYTGSFPLGLETPSKIASNILETDLYGLGLAFLHEFRERIRAVSLEEVHQTALSYLRPWEATIVVVGDLEKTIQGWENIGPVEVIQNTEGHPQDSP